MSNLLNEVIGLLEDQTGRSDINWATVLEKCLDQKGSQNLDDCVQDYLKHSDKKTDNFTSKNLGEACVRDFKCSMKVIEHYCDQI